MLILIHRITINSIGCPYLLSSKLDKCFISHFIPLNMLSVIKCVPYSNHASYQNILIPILFTILINIIFFQKLMDIDLMKHSLHKRKSHLKRCCARSSQCLINIGSIFWRNESCSVKWNIYFQQFFPLGLQESAIYLLF